MGALSRRKGGRVEREIVKLHQKMGLRAERVPLSGAQRYQGNGEDVDIYPPGSPLEPIAPIYAQVKALGSDAGTKTILGWLGEADALFLRYDAEPGQRARPPIVVLPWATWERVLKR
jgi:hypothetical protein